jgi:hypothetical protein
MEYCGLWIVRDGYPWYKGRMNLTEKYRSNAETAAVLMDAGIIMMRQNICRRFPNASISEIESLLDAWLCRADDAIPGDTAGAVRIRKRMP